MGKAVLIGDGMIASPIVEAIKATKPGFAGGSPSYTKNCQRCIVAYELRRRGYAITAKGRHEIINSDIGCSRSLTLHGCFSRNHSETFNGKAVMLYPLYKIQGGTHEYIICDHVSQIVSFCSKCLKFSLLDVAQ